MRSELFVRLAGAIHKLPCAGDRFRRRHAALTASRSASPTGGMLRRSISAALRSLADRPLTDQHNAPVRS